LECARGRHEKGKKSLWWMSKYGRVEVVEQIFRLGRAGTELRPFQVSAGVECRGASLGLQRALVDFGAEASHEKAVRRVKEHYGIEVSTNAVRRWTQHHGAARQQRQEEEREPELPVGLGAALVIGELDGSMVPIVELGQGQDRRKERGVKWEEARLALAHALGSVTPCYGATLGSVTEAGEILADCARRAGATQQTPLHCLGDAAAWIIQQVREQFGAQARYLLDFYHVSEYLAAAAQGIAPATAKQWLAQQQERLRNNCVEEVLADLQPQQEPPELADQDAPVRACLRYLINHRAFLDYASARAAGLPIGSGEVESGHRSVIQQRLKIPGAWWLRENAAKMIALRINRANNDWQSYWDDLRQAAA